MMCCQNVHHKTSQEVSLG